MFNLKGANTYTGLTTVSSGTLRLNRSGGTTLPSGNSVTVNNGGTLRISTAQTLNNVTVDAGGTLIVDSTLTITGTATINGTFQINNGGFGTGGTWTYGAGATLVYNHTASTYGPIDGTHSYWPASNGPTNVTVQGSTGQINLAVSRTVSGTFQTVAGVTLSSGAVLTCNGTCQINSGGFFNQSPTYGSSSTLIYNIGVSYGVTTEWAGNGTTAGLGIPQNVTIQNGTTVSMPNTDRGMAGNLNIISGTLKLNAGSGDLYVAGNWTNAGTFTPNNRAVFFNGSTGDQTITKSGGETFAYLTVNKSSGALVLANNVTVNGSNGGVVLQLTSGNVNAGANTLILGANANYPSAVNRTSGYVIGNLQRAIATGANTYLFPVGVGANYTPASIAFTSVGTGGNLTVLCSDGLAGDYTTYGLSATKYVNRNWLLTNGGVASFSADATFTYVAGDLAGGATAGSIKAAKFDSPNWTYPSTTTGALSFTANSITSFSKFTGGECGTITASAGSNSPICAGSNLTLTTSNPSGGTGTYTYSWAGPSYTSTAQNPTITAATTAATGTYTVTVSDAAGCTVSSTTAVTVNARPTGALSGSTTICNGGSATLSIAATGSGTINGTLSDGTAFSGTAPTITVSVSPSANTTYTIATLSDANCASSAADRTGSATVTVNARPTGALSGSTTICNGGSATLSIAATGSGTISGTLSPGGIAFSGTAPTITVSVSPSANTTYTIATLFDANCASIAADRTGSATVTVNARPTGALSGSTTICTGGAATLSIAATGSGTINGTLSPGGIAFSGTAPTITVMVSPSMTTAYTIASLSDANCASIAGDRTGGATVTVLCPDYTITTTGNAIVITDLSGNGETLDVSQSSSNLRFVVTPTTRTYTINGGAITAFTTPADVALAGANSITINTAAGADIINIGAFAALPSLTINGGTGDDAVNFNGDITFAANANLDLDLQNDNASPGNDALTVATNANILLSGTGTATVKVSQNVTVNAGASIETVNGDLLVEANQQATPTAGNFSGVNITGASSRLACTGSGTLTVKGKGGNSGSSNHGVSVQSAGSITGGSGTVTVVGNGGNTSSNSNHGVLVSGTSSRITSSGGSVSVTGTAGGGGFSTGNVGVYVFNAGTISAGGSGTVTVVGNGGSASGSTNDGVRVATGSASITSLGGNVSVTGTGGGGSSSLGITTGGGVSITTAANGGNISLIARSMELGSSTTVSANAASSVTLRTPDNIQINLGSATNTTGGPLSLSDAELDRVTGGTIIIGHAQAGTITVSADITRPASTNMQLLSGGDVTFSGGGINTGGGTLFLDPGTSPAAVKPTFNGTDATASTLSFGSDLAIVINGTTPGDGTGSTYTRLTVAGAVNLAGVDLILSGSHTPVVSQTFTIVDNDDADAIVGTFTGLAEGATISNFLGSGLTAQISYTGGTGNDVVLTVVAPAEALDFDGSNDEVSLAAVTSSPAAFSFEMWINPESVESDRRILNGTNPGNPPGPGTIGIRFGDGGELEAWTGQGPSCCYVPITASPITPNTWTHIAYVKTSATTAEFYVNGVKEVPPFTVDASSQLQLLTLGGKSVFNSGTFGSNFNGKIDELRFWGTSRSCEQINQLKNCELTGTESGLIAYYQFNQGFASGNNAGSTTLDDATSNNNDATLAGFDLTGTSSNWVAPGGVPTGTSCTALMPAPEANVQGNGTDIADGDNTPASGDHTDFGTVALGNNLVRTFTIQNTGDDDLDVSSINSNNSLFTVGALTPASPIPAGMSADFTVTFTPVASGVENATITINNNDCDETAYDFVVSGTGVVVDYAITTTSNTIVITDLSGNGESLDMSENGGNIRFLVAPDTRTYSIDGGPVTAFTTPADVALAGVYAITINAGDGDDIIDIEGFSTPLPNLTVNGGTGDDAIHFNGGITFEPDANLDVDLQDDDPAPGADQVTIGFNAELLLSGTGSATIRTSRNVLLNAGSILQTVDGYLTVEANQQTLPTPGDFAGVDLNGGIIQSTGTGTLFVVGNGGDGTPTHQYGVSVSNGGRISGGTTGGVFVQGIGGFSPDGYNYGVYVRDANSKITSSNSYVSVYGEGGDGAGSSTSNHGVLVETGGAILAGGTGPVYVQGTGGAGSGSDNFGVSVGGVDARITSTNGEVTVVGQGGGSGTAQGNYGVIVHNSGIISAGGNHGVQVQGTGSTATGDSNFGVYVGSNDAQITSSGGDILVQGQEGGGANSAGIFVSLNGSVTTAANGGSIALYSNSLELLSFGPALILTNASGSVSLHPYDYVGVDLGALSTPIGGPLNLSDAKLDYISTGTLVIGDVNSSEITISADITRAAATNVELHTVGDVRFSDGGINTGGGTLLLDPGDSPAAVKPTFTGTDATASTLSFASDLAIAINGATPGDGTGSTYTQLTVAGAVDLSGVDLILGGAHTPIVGNTFTIVENDGVEAITGTFTGLPEGATISNFLGSGLNAKISYTGGSGNDVVLTVVEPCPATGTIWYVNAAADPGGNGASWTCAFQKVQDAINVASSGHQVWVAAGTYKPTTGTNRNISFSMKDGVAIYGGFPNSGNPGFGDRNPNPATNGTVLSGDIGGAGNDDNSYHVIFNETLSNSALLDGFTITAGNADNTNGAGMYNFGGSGNSSPTIANCIFSNNTALGGGGMYCNGQNGISSPVLTNCAFINNSANSAFSMGGGILIIGSTGVSSPSLTGCTFSGNTADYGGAMFIDANYGTASPILDKCVFSGNTAAVQGGGINLTASSGTGSPVLTNCVFSGNLAFQGGGMFNNAQSGTCTPTLTNCTFSGNNSTPLPGGAISNSYAAVSTLNNCILWGNSSSMGSADGGSAVVNYSIVEGGCPFNATCSNVLSTNPLFVSQPAFASAPTTTGDLHLQASSPAIDAGTASGAPATDFDGDARPQGCGIDLGYDEYPAAGCCPTITFTATPANACADSDNGQIAISGETGGTGPYMYSKDNGANYQAGATFTGLVANTYPVKIKDNNNCESATQNIIVGTTPNATPDVSLGASPSGAICAGTPVLFTATAGNVGGGTVTYNFKVNGGSVQNSASDTYNTSALANGELVTCDITVAGGTCLTSPTASSNGITMTVNANLTPGVSLGASPSGAICAGTPVLFTATANNTGGGTVTYNFKVNGSSVQNSASDTYNTSILANGDMVTCDITVAGGTCLTSPTATSNGITMTVNANLTPGVSLGASPSGAICAGTPVLFTATAGNTGGGTVTYNFKVNGGSVQNSASNTYNTSALANGDLVTCDITVAGGTCLTSPTATSNGITMTVNANLTPGVSLGASPSGAICAGTPVLFTATAGNVGGGTVTYNFKVNGGSVQNSASNTYNTSILANGDLVTCDITVAGGTCLTSPTATSNGITMTVNANLTPGVSLGASPSGAICAGTPVMFTATAGNVGGGTVTYNFKVNGSSVQNSASNTYNTSALANGDLVTCDISVTGGTCLTSPTASSNGITMTVTANLTPDVSLGASPSGAICAGTPVLFTATAGNVGGGTVTYNFKVNGSSVQNSASDTYNTSILANGDLVTCDITVTGGTCLTSPTASSNGITMTVNANLTPGVSLGASPSGAICAGTPVLFTATANNTGGGTVTYNFKVNGSSVQNSASDTYNTSILANGDMVTCDITVAGGTCLTSPTATSNGITMTVNANLTPGVSLGASPSGAICAGTPVLFTATAGNTGGGTVTYNFKVNGGSVQNSASNTYNTSALANGDLVTCDITVAGGTCLTSPTATSNGITMTVNANLTPGVSLGASPSGAICAGTPVLFTATAGNVGGGTVTYNFKVNGGSVQNSASNTYNTSILANGDLVTCDITVAGGTCLTSPTATSNGITMTVNANLTPGVSLGASPSGAICAGTPVMFTATAGNVGGGTVTYNFKVNGSSVQNSASNTYNTSILANGDLVTCVITVAGGTCLTSPTASSNGITETVNVCQNILISGTIRWEHDGTSGVNSTTVSVAGSGSGSGLSTVSGSYTVSVPVASGNFTITPTKNINKLNGVTTADVTAIQQHVANIALLPAPFKRIAADVNKSNSINGIDASLLNQALLGSPTALSQITSWRFVPAAYTFPNPNIPWGFPEQISLTGVSGNVSGQDFKGIKLGDVVSTWANPANFGAGEPLVLRAKDQLLQAGENATVEFSADELDDLLSFQFALHFDPEQLALTAIEPLGGLPLSADNFGTYHVAEGEIRVAWAQEKQLLLNEAAPVFRLRFNVLQGGARLSELLQLEEDALPGRVYNSAYAESGVELRYSAATGTGGLDNREGLSLRNRPNPFADVTTLLFTLPEAGEAELRISDAAGRLLLSKKATYTAGRHEETLRLEGLSGLLFAELVTEQGSVVRKMLAVQN